MSEAQAQVVFLSNVRLSFPNIAEPQRRVNDAGKERISYNAEFIMPESHEGYQNFMKVYGAMAAEKWKEHAQQIMQMIHADRKLRCYGPGSEKVNKATFKVYDGYEGQMFINAGRDTMPQIVKADGSPVDPSDTLQAQTIARKMYGGCYVNAAVKPWLQDNKYGRGVRCDLIAVQFAADGEAFGAGNVDVSGMFGSAAAPAAGGPAPADAAPGATAVPGLPPFMQGQ